MGILILFEVQKDQIFVSNFEPFDEQLVVEPIKPQFAIAVMKGRIKSFLVHDNHAEAQLRIGEKQIHDLFVCVDSLTAYLTPFHLRAESEPSEKLANLLGEFHFA